MRCASRGEGRKRPSRNAHATGKTIEKIAAEHPELYAIAEQDGPLTGEAKEQLSAIVNGIFEQKMAKHNL